MVHEAASRSTRTSPPPTACRIGAVSYLNTKPLIDGLDALAPPPRLRLDVPARLLDDLQAGEVDLALCPVIDYFRSSTPLVIVPVGGICSDGPTFTVRLFSQVPIDQLEVVHADSDSHTSVALLRVLLAKLFGLTPELVDYQARELTAAGRLIDQPQAMLLIGDKVVTASPKAVEYPHQLDLGEAWKRLTGLPFVFATWLAPEHANLGEVPRQLAELRQQNARRIPEIAHRYASSHGWSEHLAERYLGSILQYEIGPRELEAIERFGALAAELGIIAAPRPLHIRPLDSAHP